MRGRVWIAALLALALAIAVAAAPVPAADGPALHFSTFVTTDLALGQVVWTGHEFLYDNENDGQIEGSDAAGHVFRQVITFDQGGEEMRCHTSPSRRWPEGIYCHTPDNRIIRIANDGSTVTQLARVPAGQNSDGALAFDTTGRFGYALLAATGGSSVGGGQVFAITPDGTVRTVGVYPGPGGAENIVVAPPRFGSASGAVLLAIDEDHISGRVLAMDARGKVQTIASGFGTGLNPIGVVVASPAKRGNGAPAAGFYVSDTISKAVLFTPAAALARYAGSVIVGTELTGQFWLIRPAGKGKFATLTMKDDLPVRDQGYNLEGATYVR